MANAAAFDSSSACAEAIAFLHLLHDVPCRPFANNRLSQAYARVEAYSLPFEKERELVGTLAFLSCVKHDIHHVPALCIHDDRVANRLEAIVAVNEARHGDGQASLERIRSGFEPIFHSMSRVLDASDTEKAIFSNIVSMCSQRILERLGLQKQKSKSKGKLTIKALLETSLHCLGLRFPEFREKARNVTKAVDSWLNHQVDPELHSVIEAVLELSLVQDLSQVLNSITNREMDPTERSSLLKIIRRVARYRQAARFLYRTAKKHPVARALTIALVRLPEAAFQTTPSNPRANSFSTVYARILARSSSQNSANRVSSLLKRREGSADELFAKQCAKTMAEGKVHAEVQLVYHMETNHLQPLPRVVASSKMACYLCNTFLGRAAKLYTPCCHGKIYPGWRLPVFLSQSRSLDRLFVQALETNIRSSVNTLLQKQRRTLHPSGTESTLWTLALSTTTISEVAEHPSSESSTRRPSPIDITEATQDAASGVLVVDTENAVDTAEIPAASRPTLQPSQPSPRPSPRPSPQPSQQSSQQLLQKSSQKSAQPEEPIEAIQGDADVQLVRGTPVALERGVDTPISLCAPSATDIRAGPLLLHLEYTTSPKADTNAGVGGPAEARARWLSVEDVEDIPEDDALFIDAEALNELFTVPKHNLHAVYITGRDHVIKLDLSS